MENSPTDVDICAQTMKCSILRLCTPLQVENTPFLHQDHVKCVLSGTQDMI